MLNQESVYCVYCHEKQPHMYGSVAGFTEDKQTLYAYHCMNCGYSSTRLEHDDRHYWTLQTTINFIMSAVNGAMMDREYYEMALYYWNLYAPHIPDMLKERTYVS